MSEIRKALIAAGAHESDAGQWTIWEDDVPKLRAALAQPETDAPRDEWRLASEPPENGRDVVVWMNDGGHGCFAIGHCLCGEWTPNYVGSPVTHWRDVQPPTEGAK